MEAVFVGGSRKIKTLPSEVKVRIDNIIKKRLFVIVGDADGADAAFQEYLFLNRYENVVVYCVNGVCRNNIGNWKTNAINIKSKKKDFSFYSKKDEVMAKDAEYGFMVWDLESKGTLTNILNLIQLQKTALVFENRSKSFFKIKDSFSLNSMLSMADDIKYKKLKEILKNKFESNKLDIFDHEMLKYELVFKTV